MNSQLNYVGHKLCKMEWNKRREIQTRNREILIDFASMKWWQFFPCLSFNFNNSLNIGCVVQICEEKKNKKKIQLQNHKQIINLSQSNF